MAKVRDGSGKGITVGEPRAGSGNGGLLETLDHAHRGHAVLSASAAKRWLNCPPSARLNEQFPNESSVYADEGTAAHELGEYKIRHGYTYASTYQYDQEEEAATTREEQTINFEVRYCTELKDLDSTHYRVSFHGKPYDIQSVDMMNYQRKTIRIVCKLDAAQKKGAKA